MAALFNFQSWQRFTRFGRGIVIALLLTLSGCAGLMHQPNHTALPRNYYDQIEMTGRLSAQYEANYREQSVSVNFSWEQSSDHTRINFYSPTGQTAATIIIDAQGAQLLQADKPARTAPTIDELSSAVFGWPLPVEGLRDWLQGYLLPDHLQALASTDQNQHQVDGWSLRYVTWVAKGDFERPKRIDLSRETERAGQVSLRIVVDSWSTP